MTPVSPTLRRLAALNGIQASFVDAPGHRRHASAEVLKAALQALGTACATPREQFEALRAGRLELWQRVLEPVQVAPADAAVHLTLRLPETNIETLRWEIDVEQGLHHEWSCSVSDLQCRGAAQVEGRRYGRFEVQTPWRLPMGYHRLRVSGARWDATCLLLVMDQRVPALPRSLGLFAPVYALHGPDTLGSGDLGDLGALLDWAAHLGANVVATLPLLSTFLDNPFDPSPYAPVSKLFWNELYLDPTDLAEFRSSAIAQSLWSNLQQARSWPAGQVAYRQAMAAHRQVLEAAIDQADEQELAMRLASFAARKPLALEYAKFRAAREVGASHGRNHEGTDRPDARRVRYHLYVQHALGEQLSALANRPCGLYLDVPIGVHRQGFDTFHYPELFAMDASVGAPPDRFNREGQNWGFPPLRPQRLRAAGYDYWREVLREHMRFARALRMDHVMGLRRLYLIPRGFDAKEGVYVRYPQRELSAVLTIEACRHGTAIFGEDLGVVPRPVRQQMAQHGIGRVYALAFEMGANGSPNPVPEEAVAALGTHDVEPFAAWCRHHPKDRRALARVLGSDPEPAQLLVAALRYLAKSKAALTLIDLADLWLERRPHNVPGTPSERNWRCKLAKSMPEMLGPDGPSELLRQLVDERRSI